MDAIPKGWLIFMFLLLLSVMAYIGSYITYRSLSYASVYEDTGAYTLEVRARTYGERGLASIFMPLLVAETSLRKIELLVLSREFSQEIVPLRDVEDPPDPDH